ncbi:heme exporter protein CcmB [Cellvibrio japonicus]|uniref:Heme exporter protein B n=1 Tax=Cellvibrio japonicus (strain Ueda107) TaxID=498211 RepID=B3PIC8_CELJU|nr:heme exporter protein CcmB [Cellvibrio japonicus]ACE82747.1 heme exporter protein CcmB [Cellvibrio japonicus Ueda107]QEI12530.1 heme exporter protein CcmB [Cellvibrio japonicus]QEI16104.1 heme exporter protein CcmB [Cellvibrio japonicus]QEI19682.1 heme exporter protein CcmB [Cellvibrio japonicus]
MKSSPAAIPGVFSGFLASLRRDWLIAIRHGADLLNPLVFFLIVITLIPLGISPEKKVLAMLAPGILWVMALLATMLSLDGLFRSDFEDGTLEQILISPQPVYFVVLAKVLVHWLTTGVPIALLSPLLGLMLSLPGQGYLPLVFSLLLGTAAMSLIGAVGAALTVSLRKGGLLLSLVVMPLYIPVLIFGASAVQSAVGSNPLAMQLAVLGAMLALALVLAPLAAAGALRISSNS